MFLEHSENLHQTDLPPSVWLWIMLPSSLSPDKKNNTISNNCLPKARKCATESMIKYLKSFQHFTVLFKPVPMAKKNVTVTIMIRFGDQMKVSLQTRGTYPSGLSTLGTSAAIWVKRWAVTQWGLWIVKVRTILCNHMSQINWKNHYNNFFPRCLWSW